MIARRNPGFARFNKIGTGPDGEPDPDDLRAALTFLAGTGVPLVVTTGGLGPTADDLTADVVAEVLASTSVPIAAGA